MRYLVLILAFCGAISNVSAQDADLTKTETLDIQSYIETIPQILKDNNLNNFYTASSDKLMFVSVEHITAGSKPAGVSKDETVDQFVEKNIIPVIKEFNPDVIITELTKEDLKVVKSDLKDTSNTEQDYVARYGLNNNKTVLGFELTEGAVIDGLKSNKYVNEWIALAVATYVDVNGIKSDLEKHKAECPFLYSVIVESQISFQDLMKGFICSRLLMDISGALGDDAVDVMLADQGVFKEVQQKLAKIYDWGSYIDLYNSITTDDLKKYKIENDGTRGVLDMVFTDLLMKLRDYNLLKLIKSNKDKKVLVLSGAVHYMNVKTIVKSWNDNADFKLKSIDIKK